MAGAALVLLLAVSSATFAQEPNDATFKERFPAEVAPETRQAPAKVAPETSQPTPERKPAAAPLAVRTTTRRVTTVRRAPGRVVVMRRSFLDAGTDVSPGERKYLDYAISPTHQPIDVVTNTGGRVGWHNSPLPGPFFPFFY